MSRAGETEDAGTSPGKGRAGSTPAPGTIQWELERHPIMLPFMCSIYARIIPCDEEELLCIFYRVEIERRQAAAEELCRESTSDS